MNQNSHARSRRLSLEALEPRQVLASASFVDVAQTHGLDGLLGGSGEFHAGGLVFTDLNADGFADLYLIGRVGIGNRLYINVDDGAGGRTFERAVGDGGTSYNAGRSTGAIAADYDNDGDLDIYLTNYRDDNILFKNMWQEDHPSGNGDPTSLRFVDVTSSTDPTPSNPVGDNQHGLARATFVNPDSLFTTQVLDNTLAAAWADVNRDGWIDLYVGSWDGTNGNPAESDDGRLGERDTLYLNNGDGTFTDVTMGLDGTGTFSLLVDDGSFESATHTGTVSNSGWSLVAEDDSAQFQQASWAASEGEIGVWFQGFRGSSSNPANARIAQTVTATEAGDYRLRFNARVEQNFAAAIDSFQVTISSNGTGGTQTFDILAAATDFNSHTHTLELPGVSAGDQITITGEMLGAIGLGGSQRSGFLDGFYLRGPGWEQVGGWQYSSGEINDTGLPAEFSGHNALQFADFNNDGWQDLIVATMGGGGVGPNRDMLYLNRGNNESGNWLGYHMVSYDIGFGGEESSDMGVAVADIDNDGDLDYFSTLLPAAHPIWINNFVETGELSFTRTSINNEFSWGANFHDFDNNGRVDLMVGTEIGRRSYLHLQDLSGNFSEQAIPAGLTTTHTVRGVAVADYDRDGWSDAAHWSWLGANPGIQLYENRSAAANSDFNFLTLQLEGDPTLDGPTRSTRDAIGARTYVTADFDGDGTVEANETRLEEVLSGHSNASTTSSLALEFGLGLATSADVRIVWGSGRETKLTSVAANQFLTIQETADDADFNQDGDIDGQDFLQWQRGFNVSAPQATHANGDANHDGAIDDADLTIWSEQYGVEVQPIVATSSAAKTSQLNALPQLDKSILAAIYDEGESAEGTLFDQLSTLLVTHHDEPVFNSSPAKQTSGSLELAVSLSVDDQASDEAFAELNESLLGELIGADLHQ